MLHCEVLQVLQDLLHILSLPKSNITLHYPSTSPDYSSELSSNRSHTRVGHSMPSLPSISFKTTKHEEVKPAKKVEANANDPNGVKATEKEIKKLLKYRSALAGSKHWMKTLPDWDPE